MSHVVWVEIGMAGLPIRIFRNRKQVSGFFREYPRREAIAAIRHQIFVRSAGYCELCAVPVTEQTMHMHEQKHRGKGGEVSLVNSVGICAICHKHEHRDREPKWSK